MFGTGATDSLAVGKISKKYGLAATGVITAAVSYTHLTLPTIYSV